MTRRLLLLLITAIVAVIALDVSPALAHNSLDSSDPVDGAVVTQPLEVATLVFAKDVPLDTLTIFLTDPSGARTTLANSAHGDAANVVVTPLPTLVAGGYSLRWRLVGADGHAVTGRVQFDVAPSAVAAVTDTSTPTGEIAPSTSVPSVVQPVESNDGEWSTPGWMRWVLRYGSYLALMVLAGVVVTEAFVVADIAQSRRVRALQQWSLVGIVVGALGQLLVLASDIAGTAPWSALGSLGAAAENPAGMALVVRVVLSFACWLLLVIARPTSIDLRPQLAALLAMGMLATWSFAGHARTMRWPWVGVPVDVVHHAAAAAWIGGLVVVGGYVLRRSAPAQSADAMQRFSKVAAVAVIAIVATGVVQVVRLVGNPSALFSGTHGRALLVKCALLAVMLVLADRNRKVVLRRFHDDAVTAHDVAVMRQTMRREVYLGAAILAVTASMVVAPPATADEDVETRGRLTHPSRT